LGLAQHGIGGVVTLTFFCLPAFQSGLAWLRIGHA
jgi:hypothetical protein